MYTFRILFCIVILQFLSGCSLFYRHSNCGYRFETLNKMGWTKTPEDEYSKKFINFASNHNGWNLEIGAAFGLTARKVVQEGGKIIVNDLDPEHLAIFKHNIDEKYYSKIKLIDGNLLDIDLEDKSIESILAARVLHMMKGSDIEKAARLMYRWLKPNGKVFVIAATPYHKTWNKFLPQYEQNLKSDMKFPGEIEDLSYWSEEMTKYNPSFMHLMDIDILSKVFTDAGFKIEKSGYISCDNRDEDSVHKYKKGSFGLILRK